MQPYPTYQSSSLSWLKQIPGHWTEKRAKWYFREVDERSDAGAEELLSVSHITGVTPRKEKDVNMFLAESYEGYKLCSPGDLVINTMWAWMGAMGVSQHRGIVSSSYGIYRQRGSFFTPQFLNFLCRLPGFVYEYGRRSKGITPSRARMYPADFFDIPLLCPPYAEQEAIVKFLEAKEREIQSFIANKRRMIELLNEQKTALINRAVTRGLNPNVPLKASGISWLGDIPQHWETAALSFRYSVQLGKMLDEKRITGRHLVPYLRNTDVQWDRINTDDLPSMDIAPHEYDRYTVRPGDLLVCEGGQVGRSAFWRGELPVCGYQKALHRLRVNAPARDHSRFLFYVMNSAATRGVFTADGNENTFAHLTCEKLRRHRFPFPSFKEQENIADFLDAHLRHNSAATTTAEREIELMEEYRTVLIAVVATGKMDVRQASGEVVSSPRPNRHFARALLSAEIVDQLHAEPTFGRIKHQKILHLCEYIAGIEEIQGEYHREAAGPLDNKLIYSVEAELKKQKWFAEYAREKFGHGYRPLEKAGGHRTYVERYWKEKQPVIQRLIDLVRSWDTERCEIFSTVYAAWNDLLIWRKPVTDDAILHEILHRWHDRKKQVPESRWRKALEWMRKENFVPTGFGKPTAKRVTEAGQTS